MPPKPKAQPFNMEIPHLKLGQKVRDWRVLYTASTSLLEDAQKIGYLPIAVDRSPADQKWASEAVKQETLKEALDELELRLDGRKTRLQALGDFCELRPGSKVTTENMSEFFFEALEAGKAAELTYDVIGIKFLKHVPGGAKLFSDNEDKLKKEMTEGHLIALFDVVKKKLAKRASKPEEASDVFLVEESEPMPKWAKELRDQVSALESTFHSRSSTSTDSGSEQNTAYHISRDRYAKKSREPAKACSICGKSNHPERKCFKRVCTKCSGKGHDADKCATRGSTRKNR